MRKARGFTLIELLVVFGILALVAGLAPVAYDRLRDVSDYRDTVRTMLGQLRAARYRALAEGREIRFSVDLTRRVYGTEGGPERTIPDTLQVRTTVASGNLPQSSQAAIFFLPSGGATGGSVDIVRASGAGTRLRVDWLSGRAVQEAIAP